MPPIRDMGQRGRRWRDHEGDPGVVRGAGERSEETVLTERLDLSELCKSNARSHRRLWPRNPEEAEGGQRQV